MARRLLLLVAAVAALSGSAPAIAVVSGEQSLLVIRATWGPKPFATEDVTDVFGKVDAFFRASSFGRMSFTTTLTPWVRAIDGAPAVSITQSIYPELNAAPTADLRRGAHTITIVAIDRAGNRSRPAIRRFIVGSS